MHEALSVLSDICPSTLANNIAFMFTNVSNFFSWNFCQDAVPSGLEDAPHFEINNPFAVQQNYIKYKNDPLLKREARRMPFEVKSSEQNALGMLVDLFDWLDGLQPLRITARRTRGDLNIITPNLPGDLKSRGELNVINPDLPGDLKSRGELNVITPNLAGDPKSRGRLAQIIGLLKIPWMVEGGSSSGSVASGSLGMFQREEGNGKSREEGNQSRRKEGNQSRDSD